MRFSISTLSSLAGAFALAVSSVDGGGYTSDARESIYVSNTRRELVKFQWFLLKILPQLLQESRRLWENDESGTRLTRRKSTRGTKPRDLRAKGSSNSTKSSKSSGSMMSKGKGSKDCRVWYIDGETPSFDEIIPQICDFGVTIKACKLEVTEGTTDDGFYYLSGSYDSIEYLNMATKKKIKTGPIPFSVLYTLDYSQNITVATAMGTDLIVGDTTFWIYDDTLGGGVVPDGPALFRIKGFALLDYSVDQYNFTFSSASGEVEDLCVSLAWARWQLSH